MRLGSFAAVSVVLSLASFTIAAAACPPGLAYPITSGDPAAGPPVLLTGLGPVPHASFFLLGSGDDNNSGNLTAADFLINFGDVDGDGRPDWRVEAPGQGPGGWGDARAYGCPAFAVPPNPPLVLVVHHEREDLDRDGKFDVFEDLNHNGILDPGEDRDGDHHLTPGGACEGVLREDVDCDGHLDFIDEDDNGNGQLDPGEDRDGDGRLDPGSEDRNHNSRLDDRPDPVVDNRLIPDEQGRVGRFYPYGAAVPASGGVIVASLAWNGVAYNLQDLTTSTDLLGPEEDLDHDGAFDVFEDFIRNGILDPGEDRDGDGRLTPPDGCEGTTREDQDCDGRLDFIHEDDNGNGRLDPGEDRDGDGRLDPGTEDRNGNQILDDRPFPSPDDQPGGSIDGQPVPAIYPYATLRPRPFRLLLASPLSLATVAASGFREAPQGAVRLRFDIGGVRLNDDVGGTRPIFDGVLLSFVPGVSIPGPLPLNGFFIESGSGTIVLPAAGNLAAGAFLSMRLSEGRFPVAGPLYIDPRSAGSNGFLAQTGRWPDLSTGNLLDLDNDFYHSPLDNCPLRRYPSQSDINADGIGDVCDPTFPNHAVLDGWASLAGGLTPGARSGAAAAFDSGRNVLVLFGGALDADSWEFDGATWRRRTVIPAPEPRRGHRMVYDAARRRVVLFGGERIADGTALGDLWEYDGTLGSWQRVVASPGPSPRADFGLARDEAAGALVLFGGRAGDRTLGDTWVYRSGAWTHLPSPRTPSPRSDVAMTWDAFRRVIVLFGGEAPMGGLLNDAWELDGAAWQPVDYRGDVPPTAQAIAGFDPDRRQVILFGGDALRGGGLGGVPFLQRVRTAATRLFDGLEWTALPTSPTAAPRSLHAGAFDSARGALVAQGGVDPTGHAIDDGVELRRGGDADGDGIPDRLDLCPLVPDPGQTDTDGDGSGDACDNCPALTNATQRDLDRDRVGDACDGDVDGDGVANGSDVCPAAYVAGRAYDQTLAGGGPDGDADGVADDCDACPLDPLNDADGDGVCGDADNCPRAANAGQEDGNGDGAGDACQPFVRIGSIVHQAAPRNTLDASVRLGDQDGDRLAGMISIAPVTTLPDVISAGVDPCASAFLPDGVAGEGFVYVVNPGSPQVLADVDSGAGCGDGLVDFALSYGPCSAGLNGSASASLEVDRPAPFPICAWRYPEGPGFDYTVHRADATMLILSGAAAPVLNVGYDKSRLPSSIKLDRLEAPGYYVLRITAGDGSTPEVADERIFLWSGERALTFNHPRRGPVTAPGRPSGVGVVLRPGGP